MHEWRGMVTVLGIEMTIGPSWNWQSNNWLAAIMLCMQCCSHGRCAGCFERMEEKVLLELRAGLAELQTSYWKTWGRWGIMGRTFLEEEECREGREVGPGGASCSWIVPWSDGSPTSVPMVQWDGSVPSISALHFLFLPTLCPGLEGASQGTLGVLRRPWGGEKEGISYLRKWVKSCFRAHVHLGNVLFSNWVMHIFFLP